MMALRQAVLASLGLIVLASAQSAKAEGFGYCYARLNGQELVTPLFNWVGSTSSGDEERAWKTYLRANWGFRDGNLADCSYASTKGDADRYYATYLERSGARVVDFNPQSKSAPRRSANRPAPAKPAAKTGKATGQVADKPQVPAKPRTGYEAEYQARLSAHEAQVAEYQRKLKAREAEIARQKAAHAAAQQAADKAKADHAAKMSMFERVLEEQRQRQRDYEAALALNNRCRSGDKQACADIKAGVKADRMADAAGKDKAETSDDDARTCVTEPVLGPSKIWKDALAATVVNGCTKAADVRLCLLREGGWHCGVQWGLKPQERFVWSAFKATGEVFWDARIRGTGRALASPE